MKKTIIITRKETKRGDDGHKIVSVRMRDELVEKLDELSNNANRSRNELITILLESALEIVDVEDEREAD